VVLKPMIPRAAYHGIGYPVVALASGNKVSRPELQTPIGSSTNDGDD
jgi:hypothetical protein